MDVSAIERFSGPPLAERAHVSDQARACVVRPGTDDVQTLVLRDLAESARDDLAWDAWRRPDGRWTVVAAVGDATPLSTWVYDPRSRSIQPEDAASHRLASEDVVVPLRSTGAVDVADDEPADRDVAGDDTSDAVAAPDAAAEPAADDTVAPDEQTDVPETATSSRSKSRKSRRASVPRWDEILFGAGQGDA